MLERYPASKITFKFHVQVKSSVLNNKYNRVNINSDTT